MSGAHGRLALGFAGGLFPSFGEDRLGDLLLFGIVVPFIGWLVFTMTECGEAHARATGEDATGWPGEWAARMLGRHEHRTRGDACASQMLFR
jgi:hypothetical protein